jgi:hypothetical protein
MGMGTVVTLCGKEIVVRDTCFWDCVMLFIDWIGNHMWAYFENYCKASMYILGASQHKHFLL